MHHATRSAEIQDRYNKTDFSDTDSINRANSFNLLRQLEALLLPHAYLILMRLDFSLREWPKFKCPIMYIIDSTFIRFGRTFETLKIIFSLYKLWMNCARIEKYYSHHVKQFEKQ